MRLGVRSNTGGFASYLNEFPGGVELESNPAVILINQPQKEAAIFDNFASTVYEVHSERLSHLPGGFELDSFPARTPVNYVKNILSPRSLRSLRLFLLLNN